MPFHLMTNVLSTCRNVLCFVIAVILNIGYTYSYHKHPKSLDLSGPRKQAVPTAP